MHAEGCRGGLKGCAELESCWGLAVHMHAEGCREGLIGYFFALRFWMVWAELESCWGLVAHMHAEGCPGAL